MPNLKNKKVIKDQQGQRKYPGRVTEIQGNTMATTGYGDIPLYVVPNVGSPMLVPANSGNRVFPGASSFTEYPIAKNGGWLEKYQDGGLKSVTGPAPKLDAKTEAEGKRIASGYNNANKQNAQISKTRNWSQADQEHSDRVKARINNPASDVGILAANMASNLTRFRNLTPEEIARVTDNPGETVNLASGIATDALTNELVGYGSTKAIPFVSKSAKSAGKYLTEETALKNAYKLNPYAFKPNPEAYYHRSPNLENIVNRETGTLQGFGNSKAGIEFSKDAGPGGTGNLFITPNGRVTKLNLKKPANSQLYFAKGVPLDFGRYNKVLNKKTGKLIDGQGYEGPYMVQVEGVPMGASTKGRAPGADVTNIGGYAVPRRPISLDEAKFYKEHWLKGYKKVPKKENGGWLDTYQDGGETDQNPLLKSKTLLLEGNDENPQDLGPDANRSGFGINDKKIHISDNRKIRATTGKKINPNVALKTGDYDENVIDSLIKYSIKYNIDPNRVLAQGLAESAFGKKDSQNIGHLKNFYRNESPYPQMMEAILEGDSLAKTNKNKKTTREEIIQGYNGYGKLFPETEKDYHGGNSKAFYEVPFGKEGYLDMDKNPLYGIEIKDLMDNVIGKDAQIQYKILKSKNPIKEEFYNPNNVKIPYRRKDFKHGGIVKTLQNKQDNSQWLDKYK